MTPETSADLFAALADPTRLRLLHLLQQEKELCVCDLGAALDVPQPTASRHLGALRRAGLVEVRREGRWKFYALAPARDAARRGLLRCLRVCLAGAEGLDADRERLRSLALRLRCT